jgi:hypothetical protein
LTSKKRFSKPPKVVSRLPQSDDSFGSSLSFDRRSTFYTSSSASFYDNIQLDLTDCDKYPLVVEARPTTTAPSVASGIASTVSPLLLARASYSLALSRTPSTIKTPNIPKIQALQDQVTKLTAIIEELKAQTVAPTPTPTPPPASDPTAPSAQDLAKQVEQVMSAVTSFQDSFHQFLAIQSSHADAKLAARKKHCSTTSESEGHPSDLESQESDGAAMDRES